MDQTSPALQRTLIRLFLAATVLAVFWRAIPSEFANWDDHSTVSENPNFVTPTFTSLWNHWRSPHNQFYVPVVYTVWWELSFYGRMSPAAGHGTPLNCHVYHGANIVVHMVNVLLVFAIVRRLIGHDWGAAAGAMLFAIHPLQVEPVAWITGMKDLLMGLLCLLSLWLYMLYASDGGGEVSGSRGESAPQAGALNLKGGRGRWCYALAFVCFVLSLLCKPTAVVLPVAIGVVDVLLLRRRPRQVAVALGPWLLVGAPLVAWTAYMQEHGSVLPHEALWRRPVVAADALAFYMYKLLVPINLAIDYGRVPAVIFKNGWAWWTWTAPAAVAAAVLWARRAALTAAAAIFVVFLLPVLGLASFAFQAYSTVADRYVYLSMLGLALAVAWGVARRPTSTTAAFCGIVLLACAGLSMRQVEIWHDDNTLFEHAVEVNPNSFVGHKSLGELAANEGDGAQTTLELLKAIDLDRTRPEAAEFLLQYLCTQDRLDEAIAEFHAVVDGRSRQDQASYRMSALQLGIKLMVRRRYADAAAQFQWMLHLNPGDAEAARDLERARKFLTGGHST